MLTGISPSTFSSSSATQSAFVFTALQAMPKIVTQNIAITKIASTASVKSAYMTDRALREDTTQLRRGREASGNTKDEKSSPDMSVNYYTGYLYTTYVSYSVSGNYALLGYASVDAATQVYSIARHTVAVSKACVDAYVCLTYILVATLMYASRSRRSHNSSRQT
jgi:hypothetical protein